MYSTIFQVKVDDNYYQNICTTCAKNLDFIYEFKSNAIACDLKLSKKVHKDVNFTYTQVSDDPLNVSIMKLCIYVFNNLIYCFTR